jgi:hypothetical protein
MGSAIPPRAPCIKGAACQALDALSKDRAGLEALKGALREIQVREYAGLEHVLGRYLLPAAYGAGDVEEIVAHLTSCWFDPTSSDFFFPGLSVAPIYGQGLSTTLSLALESTPNLPVDAWWVLDHAEFGMLNFRTPRQVTLIIATPRPKAMQTLMRERSDKTTVGYSTHMQDGSVRDRELPIPRR